MLVNRRHERERKSSCTAVIINIQNALCFVGDGKNILFAFHSFLLYDCLQAIFDGLMMVKKIKSIGILIQLTQTQSAANNVRHRVLLLARPINLMIESQDVLFLQHRAFKGSFLAATNSAFDSPHHPSCLIPTLVSGVQKSFFLLIFSPRFSSIPLSQIQYPNVRNG